MGGDIGRCHNSQHKSEHILMAVDMGEWPTLSGQRLEIPEGCKHGQSGIAFGTERWSPLNR